MAACRMLSNGYFQHQALAGWLQQHTTAEISSTFSDQQSGLNCGTIQTSYINNEEEEQNSARHWQNSPNVVSAR